MKRKRGSKVKDKKGKTKKLLVVANSATLNPVSVNTDDTSGFDDINDDQLDSTADFEAPSYGPDRPIQNISTDAQAFSDRPVVQSKNGRVKVKLKSSKMLDSQRTCSDMQTQSDTDKSGSQMASEKHGEVVEKMITGYSLLPEMPNRVAGSSSRKVASVKIKSSKGLGFQARGEKAHVLSDNEITIDSHQCETILPHHENRYNEKELSAALGVIKKIMKMDAAEPFNSPVDPVALGIPDYFDIIETPMDFGTISIDLEHGNKYMNSADVYNDVQYIWENCYRYNNKGDYILDLMKRVKKNFAKHWMAAGLYTELPKQGDDADADLDQDSGGLAGVSQEKDHGKEKKFEGASGRKDVLKFKHESLGSSSFDGRLSGAGFGNLQAKSGTQSTQEKQHLKGVYAKQKKRGRHGIDLHKSDCLCAVCVVRRRKRERNAQLVENQILATSDDNQTHEFKQEEKSPSNNNYSESASPNLEQSMGPDAEVDREEQGDKYSVDTPDQQDSPEQEKQETSESEADSEKEAGDDAAASRKVMLDEPTKDNSNKEPQSQEMVSGFVSQPNGPMDESPTKGMEEEFHSHREESVEKHLQSQILDDTLQSENSSLLRLCGTLFPNDPSSVWTGPHSLFHRNKPERQNPILAAVTMFMK